MNFIVIVKDSQNEISFIFKKTNEVLAFTRKIMEISNYTIEIITNKEA